MISMKKGGHMYRKVLLILTAAIFIFGAASSEGAGEKITASLKAYPSDYAGRCPAVITFRGKIENHPLFSPATPVTIQYKFIRSDNATDTNVRTITVPPGGSVNVSTTWTLGDPVKLPTYEGWEAIKILSPEELISKRAAFKIRCVKKLPFQHPNTINMR
jgi:hypothetical protein